jgi:hypothetical protein
LRYLTSSWRSLRDRRRLDVLDVLPDRDTRSVASAEVSGSHPMSGTAETGTNSAPTSSERHVDA